MYRTLCMFNRKTTGFGFDFDMCMADVGYKCRFSLWWWNTNSSRQTYTWKENIPQIHKLYILEGICPSSFKCGLPKTQTNPLCLNTSCVVFALVLRYYGLYMSLPKKNKCHIWLETFPISDSTQILLGIQFNISVHHSATIIHFSYFPLPATAKRKPTQAVKWVGNLPQISPETLAKRLFQGHHLLPLSPEKTRRKRFTHHNPRPPTT